MRVSVRGEEVPDDWAERWKRFHAPVLVGGRLCVRPPWEQPAAPGVARGGDRPGPGLRHRRASHHAAVASSCCSSSTPRGSFADLGCGSGVLAIAAAKLGFAPVTARRRTSRRAVDATRANARANGVTLDRVERLDLRTRARRRGRRGRRQPHAPAAAAGGRAAWSARRRPLIVSGLLDDEADEVAAAFAPLRERRRLTEKGWTALLLTAP